MSGSADTDGVWQTASNPESVTFFLRTEWDRVSGETDMAADASRVRLLLEGGRRFDAGRGAMLRPSFEFGVRHDGGDAETGTGVEFGGGVAWCDAASGFSIEGRARMLVTHADEDYEEWGRARRRGSVPASGGTDSRFRSPRSSAPRRARRSGCGARRMRAA